MLQANGRKRETKGGFSMVQQLIRKNRHAMAAVAMMVMILRALIIMRGILRVIGMIMIVV